MARGGPRQRGGRAIKLHPHWRERRVRASWRQPSEGNRANQGRSRAAQVLGRRCSRGAREAQRGRACARPAEEACGSPCSARSGSDGKRRARVESQRIQQPRRPLAAIGCAWMVKLPDSARGRTALIEARRRRAWCSATRFVRSSSWKNRNPNLPGHDPQSPGSHTLSVRLTGHMARRNPPSGCPGAGIDG